MKIALIPARAGSKRLPGKNTLPLGDKPLIAHTIEAAIQSREFDTIIVSSDDDTVLSIARQYQEIQAWERPKNLATDTATTAEVLSHVLAALQCDDGICGILLPTSPFRNQGHINDSLSLLTHETDAVISVTYYSVPVAFRMQFLNKKNGPLKLLDDSLLIQGKTRTQEHESFVHPNGAIYISHVKSFKKYNSFLKGNIAGYLMGKIVSLDIDDLEDYKIAKAIFANKESRDSELIK